MRESQHIHEGTDINAANMAIYIFLRSVQSERNWWRFDNNIKRHSSYF